MKRLEVTSCEADLGRDDRRGATDGGSYQDTQPKQDACCLLCLGLHLSAPVSYCDPWQEQPWKGISEQGILLNSTRIGCSAVRFAALPCSCIKTSCEPTLNPTRGGLNHYTNWNISFRTNNGEIKTICLLLRLETICKISTRNAPILLCWTLRALQFSAHWLIFPVLFLLDHTAIQYLPWMWSSRLEGRS